VFAEITKGDDFVTVNFGNVKHVRGGAAASGSTTLASATSAGPSGADIALFVSPVGVSTGGGAGPGHHSPRARPAPPRPPPPPPRSHHPGRSRPRPRQQSGGGRCRPGRRRSPPCLSKARLSPSWQIRCSPRRSPPPEQDAAFAFVSWRSCLGGTGS